MTSWHYLEGKLNTGIELPLIFSLSVYFANLAKLDSERYYTLNELGEEGWNLIQIIQLPNETRFIFRRPGK